MCNLLKGVVLGIFWVVFFLVFGFSREARGMDFSFGELHILTQSLGKDFLDVQFGPKNCRNIFSQNSRAHVLSMRMGGVKAPPQAGHNPGLNINVNHAADVKMANTPIDQPMKIHQRFFARAMEQWRDHGYNDRQVSLLESMNNALSPQRVHWINFRFDKSLVDLPLPKDFEGHSAIRIFDASYPKIKILGEDRIFAERGEDAALSPVELSPKNLAAGYKLPFRIEGEQAYIWHIGIGTNVKNFEGGLTVMFSHVAKLLEMHYNREFMKNFGSVEPLDALNMWVVSSAKTDLVDYYKKFGFEDLGDGYTKDNPSVVVVNSQGEATVKNGDRSLLPDGLALIGMRAGDFVKRFIHYDDVPHILFETETSSYRLGAKDLNQEQKASNFWLERNQKLRGSVTEINQTAVLRSRIERLGQLFNNYLMAVNRFAESNPSLARMDKPESEFFKDHPQYNQLIEIHRRVVDEFYRIVVGTNKNLRTDQWDLLEGYSMSLLSDFPLEALQTYKLHPVTSKPDFMTALEEALQ